MSRPMRTGRDRGIVILLVAALIVMSALIAASLLYRMNAERMAGLAAGRGQQSFEVAMFGVRHAMSVLADSLDDPEQWRDNPALFQDIAMDTSDGGDWRFTVFAPSPDDPTGWYHGVSDEAALLHLNTATLEMLSALVVDGVDAPMFARIVDYRDSDGEAETQGAEQDVYDQLSIPYRIPNQGFETVDELLMVSGLRGPEVYGEDANLNGILDRNEDDGSERFPSDDADGALDAGLRGLTTVWSYDLDVDASGEARVDLNGPIEAIEEVGLPQETLDFIRLYRAEDQLFTHPSQLLEMRYTLTQDHEDFDDGGGDRDGGDDDGAGDGAGEGTPRWTAGSEINSEVRGETLALVMDRLTVKDGWPNQDGDRLIGLVNVNTALSAVIQAVPGLDAETAARIVEARGGLIGSGPGRETTAWLVTEDIVDAEAFRASARYLTTRSGVFRVRSVGYDVNSGRFCSLEAVVDMHKPPGHVVYLRNLTRLGMPIAVESTSGGGSEVEGNGGVR